MRDNRMAARCAAWLAVAGTAAAQITVDAGPDVIEDIAVPVALQATVTGRAPADIWMGDGDLDFENKIVTYDDASGFGEFGPLFTPGAEMGSWPSDLVVIGSDTYGVETGFQFLWRLVDAPTGEIEKIGSNFTWPWITCMAYDAIHDELWAVDGNQKRLLSVDYTIGTFTPVGAVLTADELYWFIKGLAYDETTDLLFAIDDNTETLFTIDPNNNAETAWVMDVPSGPDLYDELQFFDGRLFASFKTWDAQNGWWVATTREIDYAAGTIYDVGPDFVKMSPHSLRITSMPEKTRWTQISGIGTAVFADPTDPNTTVTFSLPGTYVLELEVDDDTPVADAVQIDVYQLDCNANAVPDLTDIAQGTSLDGNANGIPDECECWPPASNYCTAKISTGGHSATILPAGLPSLAAGSVDLVASGAMPSKPALMFWGYLPAAVPFQGGTLCVQPPLARLGAQPLDPTGSTVYSIPIDPTMVTELRHYQLWYRDPGDPVFGVALSDGVAVTYCQ